jgi:putative transposase
MARPLRLEFEGALYHVMSRGNAGGTVFRSDADHALFLALLKDLCARYNVIVYAYCLMTNHYHLLIETLDPNLSIYMRQLNGIFTQKMNKKYKRRGHLFQGRFKAVLIEKENYLLEVNRYIVLNPVRAKMTRSAWDHKWSSYRAMVTGRTDLGKCFGRNEVLRYFSDDAARAINAYKAFVKDGDPDQNPFQGLKGSLYLGSEGFQETVARVLTGRRRMKEIPRASRYADRPALEELFHGVAHRGERDKRIRTAHREWGYQNIEISEYVGLHYSTVSIIINGRNNAQSNQKSRTKT